MNLKQTSRFLSLILRHQPETVGIALDPQGWVAVEVLLGALKQHGHPLSREGLFELVANNDKQRFALSADQQYIRANQGHSVEIELNLEPQTPPAILWHGTASRFLPAILQQGLQKQQRHHVHLSTHQQTALQVGARYGKVVLLQIDAAAMAQQGFVFFCSENQVWLVEQVPVEFIQVVEHENP